jgi:TolB-like protein/Tfp pilus assembly protein PilF
VADFGIARALETAGGNTLTGTGFVLGTPAYMSPEQALGSGGVDATTDVYALGCMLYEMVAGKTPFAGATPQALLAQHAAQRLPSLRSIDPSLPAYLERAIERAMAKEPADRFPTVSAFAEVLTTETLVAPLHRRTWRRRGVLAAAALAVLAVLAATTWGVMQLAGPTGPRTLAVMPLTNLSGDSAQQYLVQGVHEALIAELAQLGVSMIARTTMLKYHGAAKSIAEIARELGADGVIEGSVFRQGDSLAISARLYRGADERELWVGSYDGTLPNVVALYRGFARAIAGAIELKLSPEEQERLSRASPVNPAVYEAYLKGMYHLNRATPEDFQQALGYFNQALEQNPADPLAYTGLAFAYITLGHGPNPPTDVWPRARAAAERAVRLDSTLPEAWAALADIRTYYEWDWAGAEEAFARADRLNPSLPLNHYHHAWYLALFGRADEAIAEHKRARELDPLTPLFSVWLPSLYMHLGQIDRALAEARKNIEQYPDHPIALLVLGRSAAESGLYEEAITAHEKMASINPSLKAALGHTYAVSGRLEDARRILSEVEAEPPTSWRAYGLADMYTALGETDKAIESLSYEPPHAFLPWSGMRPTLKPLRDDPRFKALLRRMNLPD